MSRVYDDDAGMKDECMECGHRDRVAGHGADAVYECSAEEWTCPLDGEYAEYAECVYGDDDDARVGCGQYLYADNGAVAVCTQPRGVEHDHDQSVEDAVANGHAVWATTN